MTFRDGFIDTIGRTPLIRLKRISEATGCTILAKAEFLNPGGSIKDRAAWSIVETAEKSGLLRPGGTIVEGTAGNTGIGLTLVANARGYRSVVVMPETQSQEKKDMLRMIGADLRLVPAVPYRNPNNYVHYSRRLAEELAPTEPNGVLWADQFDNTANRDGHYRTTGPEIWEQTEGRIDGFICAVGTGGTLAGVGQALKERRSDVQVWLADPMGSALHSFYRNGELKAEGGSITEGIGQGRITRNLNDAPIDHSLQVTDAEAISEIFAMLRQDGLLVGLSSGVNVMGAVKMARALGPGRTIATILCDGGQRYQSKLFNAEFLAAKGLPVPDWLVPQGTDAANGGAEA